MIRARLAHLFLLLILLGRTLSAATAPTITTQPANQTVTLGAKATFSVVASGTAPLTYQWSKKGSVISGATSASYTTPTTVIADSGATFTVKVTNSAGTKTSNTATLTLNLPPTITTQPSNQSVVQGSAATFSVVASGTGTLAYQWSKNAAAINGATSASYTTPANVAGDNGATFTVKVTSTYGTTTSAAAALTVTAPVAPSITTQPASKTVTLGSTATFTVMASGTAPLTYQWSRSGIAISGATSASYTTPATVLADNGAVYTVKVTNTAGMATSSAATLTLNLPPTVSTQPMNQSVVVGGTATFTVVASGTGTLTYQWSKKGILITGATSASYTTPATVIGDNAATFTVKVSNTYGTATSAAATLTVTALPTITSFAPLTGTVGTTVTLTGTNFTGATAVKFNGMAASSFKIVSATSITAITPSGATTGTISATTPSGTANSTATYTFVSAPITTITAPSAVTTGIGGYVASVPNQPGSTYVWTVTRGTMTGGSGTNSITYKAGSIGTLILSCKVTNSIGTAATGTKSEPIVAAPSISSFGPTPQAITPGGIANLTAIFTNGTGVVDQGVGAVTSDTMKSVSPLSSTVYTLTVTNAANTSETAIVTVVVGVPPDATVTAPTKVTAGQRGYQASVPSLIPGQTYTWRIVNGTITSGEYAPIVVFKAGVVGTPVSLQCFVHTADNNFVSQGTAEIPVFDPPNTLISAPMSTVVGTTGITAYVPAMVGSVYTWSIQGGTITSGGTTNAVTFDAPAVLSGPITLACNVTNIVGTSSTGYASIDLQNQIGDATGVFVFKYWNSVAGDYYPIDPFAGQIEQLVLVQSGNKVFGWGTRISSGITPPVGTPLPLALQSQAVEQVAAPPPRTGWNWAISPGDLYSISGTIANGVIQGTAWNYAGSALQYFTWPISADGSAIQMSNDTTNKRFRIPGAVGVVFETTRLLLGVNGTTRLMPTVIGSSNSSVTWEFQGAPGEAIGIDGTYTAPNTPGIYAVTARSVADPNQSATTFIRVTQTGNLELGSAGGNRAFQVGSHLILDTPGEIRHDGTISGLNYSGTWQGAAGSTGLFNYTYDPLGPGFVGFRQNSTNNQSVTIGLGSYARGYTYSPDPSTTPIQLYFNNNPDSTNYTPQRSIDPSQPPSIWGASFGVAKSIGGRLATYVPSLKPGLSLVKASFANQPALETGIVCVNLVPRGTLSYAGVYQTDAGEFTLWPDRTFKWTNTSLGVIATGTVYTKENSLPTAINGDWIAGANSGTFEIVLDVQDGSFTGQWQSNLYSQHEWQGNLIPGTARVTLSAPTTILNTGGGIWLNAAVTGAADSGLFWTSTGGSISANGFYEAPNTPGSYVVTATSTADATQRASLTFQVIDYPLFTNLSGAFVDYSNANYVLFQNGLSVRILKYYNGPSEESIYTLNGDRLLDQNGNEYSVSPDGNSLTKTAHGMGGGYFFDISRTGAQPAAVVALSPKYASLAPSQTFQFDLLSAGGIPTLSAAYGTIDSTGFYTAPAFPIRDTVTFEIPGGYPTGSAKWSISVDVIGAAPVNAQGTYWANGSPHATLSVTGSGNALSGTLDNDGFGLPIVLTGNIDRTTWAGNWFVAGDSLRQGSFTVFFDPTASSATLVCFDPTGPVGRWTYNLDRSTGIPYIFINPNSPTIGLDSTIKFSWTAAAGKNIPSVNWSVLEANGGTIDVFGNYTAPSTPGTFTVIARSSTNFGFYGQTTVTVQPPITITPTMMTMPTGSSMKFGYTLIAPTNRVTWSASGGAIAADGTYTAPLVPGTYTVTVAGVDDPTATASATVTVVYTNVTLSVTPIANLFPGQTIRMGYQSSAGGVIWAASGGSFNGDSYTAPTAAGTYTITATAILNPLVSVSIQVVVVRPQIMIAPSRAVVALSSTYQFQWAVTGGSLLWSVLEPGGGAITNTGLYSAPSTIGTYTVRAVSTADNSLTATATVVVNTTGGSGAGTGGGSTPPQMVGVGVSPALSLVRAGTYQAFNATVSAADDQSVTWTVAGNPTTAKVDSQGVFTASHPGQYQVVATSVASGTSWGSATVMVTSSVDTLAEKVPAALNRQGYSVTALPSGKILIAGGWDGSAYRSDGYLYDPATQAFTPTGSMLETKYTYTDPINHGPVSMTVSAGRSGHTATLLKDGRVLIANGKGYWFNDNDPATPKPGWLPWAQVYDPTSGLFQFLPGFPDVPGAYGNVGNHATHTGGTSLPLANGQALLVGGDRPDDLNSSVSLFDATGGLFTSLPTSGLGIPDPYHPGQFLGIGAGAAVASLSDGRALVVGGYSETVTNPPSLDSNYDHSATLYDPQVGFIPNSPMTSKRTQATATTLADGRVLIIGGAATAVAHVNGRDFHAPTNTVEIFDPKTGTFAAAASMNWPRAAHASILLPTGQVLVVGGYTDQTVNPDGSSVTSYPTETELYDPDSNSWSVMDDLGYGLDSPQLALLQDGSVFIAGTQITDAPASQAAIAGNSKLKMANKLGAASAAAATPSATPTTIFGIMNSTWRVWQPFPEEASLTDPTTPDVVQIAGTPNLSVPSMTRISIPLPVGADQTPGSQNLWAGVNRRHRYFILKVQKPSKNHQITGVTVTINAGGLPPQDVLVNAPLAFGVGNGFPANEQANQILPPEGIPVLEPEIQIDALLPEDQFTPDAWVEEKDREVVRKSWISQGAWRPPSTTVRTLQWNDLIEYYRVRVTFDADRPSTINYGVIGGAIVSPPSDTVTYQFKLHYSVAGLPITQPFQIPTGHPPVEAHWSAAQFFRNSWFGTWNNDKWVNKSTFDWLSDPSRRNLLGPVNDITLEHGRNTSHGMEHFTGDRIDMYHPGYQAFTHSNAINGSGGDFRDSYLIGYLRIARGDYTSPDISQAQAIQGLNSWVSAARTQLEELIDDLPVWNRPMAMIYMITQPSSTQTELYCDGYQLYRLLTQGSCGGYQRVDSHGIVLQVVNGVNLTGIGAWTPDYVGRFQTPWVYTNHTDHLHLKIAR